MGGVAYIEQLVAVLREVGSSVTHLQLLGSLRLPATPAPSAILLDPAAAAAAILAVLPSLERLSISTDSLINAHGPNQNRNHLHAHWPAAAASPAAPSAAGPPTGAVSANANGGSVEACLLHLANPRLRGLELQPLHWDVVRSGVQCVPYTAGLAELLSTVRSLHGLRDLDIGRQHLAACLATSLKPVPAPAAAPGHDGGGRGGLGNCWPHLTRLAAASIVGYDLLLPPRLRELELREPHLVAVLASMESAAAGDTLHAAGGLSAKAAAAARAGGDSGGLPELARVRVGRGYGTTASRDPDRIILRAEDIAAEAATSCQVGDAQPGSTATPANSGGGAVPQLPPYHHQDAAAPTQPNRMMANAVRFLARGHSCRKLHITAGPGVTAKKRWSDDSDFFSRELDPESYSSDSDSASDDSGDTLAPGPHLPWLQALAPLAAAGLQQLTLHGYLFGEGEISALPLVVPELTSLSLELCAVPVTDLPRLTAMTALRQLDLALPEFDSPLEAGGPLVAALERLCVNAPPVLALLALKGAMVDLQMVNLYLDRDTQRLSLARLAMRLNRCVVEAAADEVAQAATDAGTDDRAADPEVNGGAHKTQLAAVAGGAGQQEAPVDGPGDRTKDEAAAGLGAVGRARARKDVGRALLQVVALRLPHGRGAMKG